MKLAVGICGFQDIRGLRRLVESLPPEHVNAIFYIDGKYPDFEADNELSNDGSTDYIIRECKHDMRVVSAMPKDEVTKRNHYLELCELNKIDYLLILDTDEYVLPGADWVNFKRNAVQTCSDENGHYYGVRFIHHGYVDYPRMWYKPYQVEYHRNHNMFRDKKSGAIVKSGFVMPIIEGINCTGNDDMRDFAWVARCYQYQVKLIQKEIATKHELGYGKRRDVPWEVMTDEQVKEAEK